MPVKSVLVIGGGIAGVTASLNLADRGYQVYLVEREPVIGGRMLQLSKVFPTMERASSIILPKVAACHDHPNITVFTQAQVTGIAGEAGNYTVKVDVKPRYVDVDRCIGCGDCIERCPVEVAGEPGAGLFRRKAIYRPLPKEYPNLLVVDAESCLHLRGEACNSCQEACPTNAINLDAEAEELELRVGVVIVAIGLDQMNPGVVKEYGYGRYRNVVSTLELERMLLADGPTQGRLVRPSDGREAKRIAFIQCVGSRSLRPHERPYCSSVCCMNAVKEAVAIKERSPDAEVYVFYTDLRAYGRGWQEFVDDAEKRGVKLVRARPSEVVEDPKTGDITLWYEDTRTREMIEVSLDLVVLSSASVPHPAQLANALGIDVDEHGFITVPEPLRFPVDTSKRGILASGSCLEPMDIPTSITQAYAAAFRASELLQSSDGVGRKVLVVGAGPTGLTASLALAKLGFEVHLVEKGSEVGGLLRRLDRLYPTDEPASNLLGNLLEQVKAEKQIHLYTSSEVVEVKGSLGEFQARIAGENGEQTLKVDAIVVATGAAPYEPEGFYGYGTYEKVVTQVQLEEMLRDGRLGTPNTIVMIQCVGSRDPEGIAYCSRICCRVALKNALRIKELSPNTDIYILYRDVQAYGVEGERVYRSAQRQGVKFIQYTRERPPSVDVEGERLRVRVYHALLGRELSILADLVVLSTPLVQHVDGRKIAQTLGIRLGRDGFIQESDLGLSPVDTNVRGVYVCGTAQGPKTVQNCITQAYAVAGRLAAQLAHSIGK